jgi:tetratricopeptide (TPR) repeat protein
VSTQPAPRTVLEAELQRRGWTLEECSRQAEAFARAHHINATLSPRHLQRLTAGHGTHGQPLGPIRPGTRRLLETMFTRPADELLNPPPQPTHTMPETNDPAAELRARMNTAQAMTGETAVLFQQKLELTRVLDRRLGSHGLLGELCEQIHQIERLLRYTLRPDIRATLARILVDYSTLAGWQSLDRREMTQAWHHYNRAITAAREAAAPDLEAYAHAAQATVLLDIGEPHRAQQLTHHARTLAATAPPLLQAWLAAAHGETCAHNQNHAAALRAFDEATHHMPTHIEPEQTPYIVFGHEHLTRWHGSALAALGDHQAITVLTNALTQLDPTFTRAETALRVDLATAHATLGNHDEARANSGRAWQLAQTIGSTRQQHRLAALGGSGAELRRAR